MFLEFCIIALSCSHSYVIECGAHFGLFLCAVPGPDYIRQKYNEPVEVKEDPVEEKKEKSSGSPHFYRKGTTPTQSPSDSPVPSPAPSPTAPKKTFFSSKASVTAPPTKPAGKENKTPTADCLTAGRHFDCNEISFICMGGDSESRLL